MPYAICHKRQGIPCPLTTIYYGLQAGSTADAAAGRVLVIRGLTDGQGAVPLLGSGSFATRSDTALPATQDCPLMS